MFQTHPDICAYIPERNHLIKTCDNAFKKRILVQNRSLPLKDYFSEKDIDTLVLVGFNRDVCVIDSVEGGANAGLTIVTCLDYIINIKNRPLDPEIVERYEKHCHLCSSPDELRQYIQTYLKNYHSG